MAESQNALMIFEYLMNNDAVSEWLLQLSSGRYKSEFVQVAPLLHKGA